MRVVFDTNVLVSAALSPESHARRLLDHARAQRLELCSSPVLIAELLDVLSRPKFATRLQQAGLGPLDIVKDLRNMAHMASPISVPHVIAADPDDDHVLACPVAANADLIVTGDKHFHDLGGTYQGIRILTPAQTVSLVPSP